MVIGTTLLVVGIIVVLIWIFVEIKRAKHKILAILLIVLILFAYFGFVSSVKGKDIDFKSLDGLKYAGKLYLSWMGNVFANLKTLSGNAIKMDWKGDNSLNQKDSKK